MADDLPQAQETGSSTVPAPVAQTGRTQASKRRAMMGTVSWAQLSAMYGDDVLEQPQGAPGQRRTTWAPTNQSPLAQDHEFEEPKAPLQSASVDFSSIETELGPPPTPPDSRHVSMPPGSVEPFLLQQTIGVSSKVAAQSKKAAYRAQTIKPTSGMDHRPKTEPVASSSSTPSSTSSSSTKNSTYDEYLALAKTTNFDAIRDAHFAYQSGLDFAGRPVVVVCGTMPEGASADDLFLYIIDLLDPIADGDYSVVYVVMPDGRKPSFGWLRKVYGNITRKYKKNLKQLFIVNPSFWVKAGFQFFRPFISSKFWKKVVYVTEMRQLYQFMSPTQIRFPAYVTDKINFAKNAAALFGQSLEVAMTHPMNEGFEVPCLVHSAIEAIIAKGLKTEGIFRISGNANRIKELQEAFDKGTRVDLSQENEIHNVAGLLKRYLRQLPEPLIPFAVFPNMITVASEETPADIKQALIQALLCELSPLSFAILDRVIRLMGQIAANESFNKMGASNLAIVLGPNIMYAENDTPATAMANATAVNIIVKMFISDADVLFSAVRTKFDL